MPEATERLMLLDSASLYFRAFHGVPDSVRSPRDEPVNAVRGFLDNIAYLVGEFRPTRLVCCWDDDWRPAFRVAALPSYKAHRAAPGRDGRVEEVPAALTPQVPVIVDVLAALGIARQGAAGYEADDVMATLAQRADCPVDVVTGDRDLFQVVDDARAVRVLYVGRGVRRLQVFDQSVLAEKYGVPDGPSYAGMAALRGDPSDGLPGVPGIGEKTAATLLRRAGTLAGLLRALDDGDDAVLGAQRGKPAAAREYLEAAPRVVDVVRDIEPALLPEVDATLPLQPADPEALLALDERWGLRSSLNRVLHALAARG
ncbi:5'-3' exonuclease [Angustibacter aerolatus]|uniref:5'-3' exonuclease n=1 Tax=Angustibacter aerolatus TaxID=1162965 RepID=A0ABQ6JNK2_9ACTN|nr:5'-3' exonuclease [Angustibacter aerolatus]GMA89317.1 5'-3' exonuclease [Angustibacter aerolatus]